jgi:hypothetical protein
MKATTMNRSTYMARRETTDPERLLSEAGFSFTVVDRCPDEGCEACRPTAVPAAA